MDSNETFRLPWTNFTTNYSSLWKNYTDKMDAIYVFTPAGDTAKRVLCFFFATVAAVSFLGNCFIFYFIWQKPSRNPIQSTNFVRTLDLYLKSLALSDVLSCAVSLPLLCTQISFDVFQSGWRCKVVRYANFVFPCITVNNLVAISLEKYLSTRTVLRTFSFSKMRKIIICAWILGLVAMLFPAAAYNGIRLVLNSTHYTVVCNGDQDFYPFRISLIIFPLQYILPCALVTYINICLMKTVWSRGRRQIANGTINNTFKTHLRAKKIRGTTLLVALTFAFIIPYLFFICNIAYTQIAKPQRDFPANYIIRYAGGGIAGYFSGLANFIIYFAQVKEFREFLKKRFLRKNNEMNQDESRKKRENCPVFDKKHAVAFEDNAVELKKFKTSNPV